MVRTKLVTRAESRFDPRTKLLLAAVLSYGERSVSCHVRNLSLRGAMIQAAEVPPQHATVTLRRGNLFSAGEVAWTRSGLLGLRFSTDLDIDEWLSAAQPMGVKRKVGTNDISQSEISEIDPAVLDGRIADEIAFVARTFENASERLVADPVLRVRHADLLQQLAIGNQMLEQLGSVVRSPFRIEAVQEIVNGPMRQRLLRRQSST